MDGKMDVDRAVLSSFSAKPADSEVVSEKVDWDGSPGSGCPDVQESQLMMQMLDEIKEEARSHHDQGIQGRPGSAAGQENFLWDVLLNSANEPSDGEVEGSAEAGDCSGPGHLVLEGVGRNAKVWKAGFGPEHQMIESEMEDQAASCWDEQVKGHLHVFGDTESRGFSQVLQDVSNADAVGQQAVGGQVGLTQEEQKEGPEIAVGDMAGKKRPSPQEPVKYVRAATRARPLLPKILKDEGHQETGTVLVFTTRESKPADGRENKQRMRWTKELRANFKSAVRQLGGMDRATPKRILRAMAVPGLSLWQVKSFLQKYRLTQHGVAAQSDEESTGDEGQDSPGGEGGMGEGEIESGDTEIEGEEASAAKRQKLNPSTTALQITLQMQMKVMQEVETLLEEQCQMQAQIEAQQQHLMHMLTAQHPPARCAAEPPSAPNHGAASGPEKDDFARTSSGQPLKEAPSSSSASQASPQVSAVTHPNVLLHPPGPQSLVHPEASQFGQSQAGSPRGWSLPLPDQMPHGVQQQTCAPAPPQSFAGRGPFAPGVPLVHGGVQQTPGPETGMLAPYPMPPATPSASPGSFAAAHGAVSSSHTISSSGFGREPSASPRLPEQHTFRQGQPPPWLQQPLQLHASRGGEFMPPQEQHHGRQDPGPQQGQAYQQPLQDQAGLGSPGIRISVAPASPGGWPRLQQQSAQTPTSRPLYHPPLASSPIDSPNCNSSQPQAPMMNSLLPGLPRSSSQSFSSSQLSSLYGHSSGVDASQRYIAAQQPDCQQLLSSYHLAAGNTGHHGTPACESQQGAVSALSGMPLVFNTATAGPSIDRRLGNKGSCLPSPAVSAGGWKNPFLSHVLGPRALTEQALQQAYPLQFPGNRHGLQQVQLGSYSPESQQRILNPSSNQVRLADVAGVRHDSGGAPQQQQAALAMREANTMCAVNLTELGGARHQHRQQQQQQQGVLDLELDMERMMASHGDAVMAKQIELQECLAEGEQPSRACHSGNRPENFDTQHMLGRKRPDHVQCRSSSEFLPSQQQSAQLPMAPALGSQVAGSSSIQPSQARLEGELTCSAPQLAGQNSMYFQQQCLGDSRGPLGMMQQQPFPNGANLRADTTNEYGMLASLLQGLGPTFLPSLRLCSQKDSLGELASPASLASLPADHQQEQILQQPLVRELILRKLTEHAYLQLLQQQATLQSRGQESGSERPDSQPKSVQPGHLSDTFVSTPGQPIQIPDKAAICDGMAVKLPSIGLRTTAYRRLEEADTDPEMSLQVVQGSGPLASEAPMSRASSSSSSSGSAMEPQEANSSAVREEGFRDAPQQLLAVSDQTMEARSLGAIACALQTLTQQCQQILMPHCMANTRQA